MVLKIAHPKNVRELWHFIGMVNYYRDMRIRCSHVLAQLAALTSKKQKWKWEEHHQKAFDMAQKILPKRLFWFVLTSASRFKYTRMQVITNWEVFCSHKLNPAQTHHTTTERELLSMVETLKEYRNILLGQQIEVFTDHQNLDKSEITQYINTRIVSQLRKLSQFGFAGLHQEQTVFRACKDTILVSHCFERTIW